MNHRPQSHIVPASSKLVSRRTFVLFLAGLVAAFAVHASDPWKDKDFADWDQKDVQKILTDSPWARQIQFGMLGGEAVPSAITASTPSPVTDPLTGNANSRTPLNAGSTAPSQGTGPVIQFTVSWISSRTIREAKARTKELAGMPPEEARTNLSTKYDNYQIAITGVSLNVFGREGAENLKAQSYLMSKKSKEKVAPSRVFIELGDSSHPGAVIYEFPRKSATGSPTIPTGEKGAEFFTLAGKLPIKISFDISKMSDKQGPDL